MSGAAVTITSCVASNSVVIDHKFSGQKSVMRPDNRMPDPAVKLKMHVLQLLNVQKSQRNVTPI